MTNYKCTKCLRKHLSVCKSFMREVINGHGKNGNPDHRIDVEGELTNAEYHASLINDEFTRKLRSFRRNLQIKNFSINSEDLLTIDVFYYMTYTFDNLKISPEIVELYSILEIAPKESNIEKLKDCQCNL